MERHNTPAQEFVLRLLPWSRPKFLKLLFFMAEVAHNDEALDFGQLDLQFTQEFQEMPREDSVLKLPDRGHNGKQKRGHCVGANRV